MKWILVRTKGRREVYASLNVERQGYEFYLPMVVEQKIKKNKKCEDKVPMFPSYLFVRIGEQWAFLQSTYGVSHVVLIGGRLAVVPDREIDGLMAREISGVVNLPNREESGQSQFRQEEFRPGQRVKITEGGLIDRTGWYIGMTGAQRVKLLLDLLGQKVPTTVDRLHVVAAEDESEEGSRSR